MLDKLIVSQRCKHVREVWRKEKPDDAEEPAEMLANDDDVEKVEKPAEKPAEMPAKKMPAAKEPAKKPATKMAAKKKPAANEQAEMPAKKAKK